MGQMRMFFVVVVLCLGAAIGFAGGQGEDAEIQSEIAIGISVIGTTHNWDINAFNGAINRARELGARVVAFDGERRTEKQLSDIGSLISIGVDAIIVILGDAQSLTPALAEARAAGIPIVTADFDNPHTMSNVSTDNEEAMAELVEYLVQDIDESGQLGIFYTPGIPIADQRKRVFDSVIARYPDVTVVSEQPWQIPGTVPHAYETAQDMLRSNPEIDAFWTVFDMPMIGAAQAIADTGGDSNARVYGFDGDPTAMQMIMDSESAFAATVAQQPYIIGQTAADIAFRIINGEEVPRNVFVDHILVTRDNVQDVFDRLPQYQ